MLHTLIIYFYWRKPPFNTTHTQHATERLEINFETILDELSLLYFLKSGNFCSEGSSVAYLV